MINNINLNLFDFINVSANISNNILNIAIFFAKRLIIIFPLITLPYWFWGKSKNLFLQRVFMCKTYLAIIISLTISGLIGIIFPQDRPFLLGKSINVIQHLPTPSFPSNHATIAFTYSFGFLFWLKNLISLLLFIPAFIIAWARIFFQLHWFSDIVGSFLVSMISCGMSQIIWKIYGNKLIQYIIKVYQVLFSPFIKKGWIKG